MRSINHSKGNSTSGLGKVVSLFLGFMSTLAAHALTFNVTYDASVTSSTNSDAIQSAFTAATQTFQSLYTNTMTVNLTVFYNSSTSLGASSFNLTGNPTYAQLTNALRAARTTAADSNSVASLPGTSPVGASIFWIPLTEAKALNGFFGVATNDPGQDGDITFASTVNYTFDPTNRAVAGKFDFIAVAEHELSEVLGRGFLLNYPFDGYQPYDLFRFTNSSARSFSVNDTNVYFSVDNGVTALKSFYTNVNFGDVQDWQSSSPADACDAFLTSGKKATLSSADLTALDILGYNLNFVAPRLTGTKQGSGNLQLNFTNVPGLNFSILASTNLALAATNWPVLGTPAENPAGQYRFTDAITSAILPGTILVSRLSLLLHQSL